MTQQEALDILKLGHNVLLTGSAGSGKTFVLNKYIDYLKGRDVPVAITASTGIAATHIGGVTIHSWSGMGIRDSLSDRDLAELEERKYIWDRFQKTKVLVIDEISMLDHKRFDMLDGVCRYLKRNQEPFGGMQVILCGDFFQLPPVWRPGEPEIHFVFKSDAWNDFSPKVCYLHEQFRQQDTRLISVLNDIRRNVISDESFELLKSRAVANLNEEDMDSDEDITKLYTHNADIDGINNKRLSAIQEPERVFSMASTGNPKLVEVLKKSCLAPEKLRLKKGTRVMFVKNNYDVGYFNGTLGTVVAFGGLGPIVRTVNGRDISVAEASWAIADQGKTLAEISQIPLRLAWAITIHKSQGMSLDSAVVDLSKSFEKGMGYVALSRVRSLDGLYLLGLNDTALKVDEGVLEFDKALWEDSEKLSLGLKHMDVTEKAKMQKGYLDSIAPVGKKNKKKEKLVKISTFDMTKEMILKNLSLKEVAKKRGITVETVLGHLEKLIETDSLGLDQINYLKPKEGDFLKIETAFLSSFKETGQKTLSPVHGQLRGRYSFNDLRLARLFIEFV